MSSPRPVALDWRQHAACATLPADWWWTKEWFGLARHVCLSHCPVLAQCRRMVEDSPQWSECVVAGVAHAVYVNGKGYREYVSQPEPDRRGCERCRT